MGEALPVIQNYQTGYLAVAGSSQPKTGDMGQIAIGRTKDEGLASCKGCSMLSKKLGGTADKTKCYHWGGSSQLGHISMAKANAKDPDKVRENIWSALDPDSGLKNKLSAHANYIRLAVGGDPSALELEQVEDIRAAADHYGLGVLGYTHFPEGKGAHLKGEVMASADDLESADRMVDAGWRVAVMLKAMIPDIKPSKAGRFKDLKKWEGQKFSTPSGRSVTICPAQTGAEITLRNGRKKRVQCNDCGMCDAKQRKGGDIIGFLKH